MFKKFISKINSFLMSAAQHTYEMYFAYKLVLYKNCLQCFTRLKLVKRDHQLNKVCKSFYNNMQEDNRLHLK